MSSNILEPGDSYEVLENATIYAFSIGTDERRSSIKQIFEMQEGDYITFVGRSDYRQFTLYRFMYSPCDENGELIGPSYSFYIKDIAKFFESIGYEVE